MKIIRIKQNTLLRQEKKEGASFKTEGWTHKNKHTNGSTDLQMTLKNQSEIGFCLAKPQLESWEISPWNKNDTYVTVNQF